MNVKKTALTTTAALILIGSLAACSATVIPATVTPATDSSPAASAAAAPAKAGSFAAPFPAGAGLINSTTGYKLSFTNFSANATAAVAAENQFNAVPAAGMQFASVDITITNTSTGAIDPAVESLLIGMVVNGKNANPASAFLANPMTSVASIFPGTSATGSKVFEVPIGSTTGLFVVGGVFVSAN